MRMESRRFRRICRTSDLALPGADLRGQGLKPVFLRLDPVKVHDVEQSIRRNAAGNMLHAVIALKGETAPA